MLATRAIRHPCIDQLTSHFSLALLSSGAFIPE
jgi:hypothetical protein